MSLEYPADECLVSVARSANSVNSSIMITKHAVGLTGFFAPATYVQGIGGGVHQIRSRERKMHLQKVRHEKGSIMLQPEHKFGKRSMFWFLRLAERNVPLVGTCSGWYVAWPEAGFEIQILNYSHMASHLLVLVLTPSDRPSHWLSKSTGNTFYIIVPG